MSKPEQVLQIEPQSELKFRGKCNELDIDVTLTSKDDYFDQASFQVFLTVMNFYFKNPSYLLDQLK